MSRKMKLIPELRFPEFVNDGGWLGTPLIATVDKNVKWSFTGGPFGSNLKASDYTESGFRIIQLQNIGDGEFNDDYKIYTSLEKADELLSCNIYAGDIILSKMGDPVGRACIIPKHLERCVMASDGIRLVVDEKKHSKYFIYSLINSKQIREAIERESTGSTRKRIGLNDLKKVELILPINPIEQKKIASCLSSLDELITAHSDKLETLKDHKKGLMQNLFPQKGRKVPNYRFPGFEKDGEWVEKALGKICNLQAGKFVKASEIFENRFDNLFPCYGGNGLRGYTKSFTHKGKYSLIGRQGALCGNITLADGQFHATEHAVVVTPEKKVDTDWLFYTLVFLNLNQYATGQAQPGLSVANLEKVKLRIPKLESEQQIIAFCLSSLDELITAQSEKIKLLQQHKKGLMQGLFPKI